MFFLWLFSSSWMFCNIEGETLSCFSSHLVFFVLCHFVFLVHMGEGSAQYLRTLWEKFPVFCCWVPLFFPTDLTWIVFRPSLVSFLAMSWTNKNKAEIFEHLEEIGISRSAARELLRTPPEKEPTKKGGLLLIKAAVRPISGASLMSSPWAEVVQAVWQIFN